MCLKHVVFPEAVRNASKSSSSVWNAFNGFASRLQLGKVTRGEEDSYEGVIPLLPLGP